MAKKTKLSKDDLEDIKLAEKMNKPYIKAVKSQVSLEAITVSEDNKYTHHFNTKITTKKPLTRRQILRFKDELLSNLWSYVTTK